LINKSQKYFLLLLYIIVFCHYKGAARYLISPAPLDTTPDDPPSPEELLPEPLLPELHDPPELPTIAKKPPMEAFTLAGKSYFAFLVSILNKKRQTMANNFTRPFYTGKLVNQSK